MTFSYKVRERNIRRMQDEISDVVVIGGGITGAGVARDAALRNLSVSLVEKGDFASGTSSKSARMIHGGIRYLEQYQFGLVMSACAERHRLRKLAPRLVHSAEFVYPVFRNAKNGTLMVRFGLWLYELMALFRNIRRHQSIPVSEAVKRDPILSGAELDGAIYYYDCLADDSRLTLATIKSANHEGALVANHVEVIGLLKNGGQVEGVEAVDQLTGRPIKIRASVVANTAGVWVDKIRCLDDPTATKLIYQSRGSHVVVSREILPINNVIVFAGISGRRMYAVPWANTVIVGTTDVDHDGDVDDVYASAEEVENIIAGINVNFPSVNLTQNDIMSTFSGLRPLVELGGKSAYRTSRDHVIIESESGLFSLFGGKLTTHRKMAEDLVNRIVKKLKTEDRLPITAAQKKTQIPLYSSENDSTFKTQLVQIRYPWAEAEIVDHLINTYGSDASIILTAADEERELRQRITPNLPYILAEIRFSVENEMALTLRDFLIRRTHIMYEASDQGLGVARQVGELMGDCLNWESSEIDKEVQLYIKQVMLTRRYAKEPTSSETT